MRWSERKIMFLVSRFSFFGRSGARGPLSTHVKRGTRTRAITRAAVIGMVLLLLLQPAPSAEEKQLSIYGPRTYSLPVADHNGQDYVALLEALEPLGSVSARVEGQKWKLRFNHLEAEFRQKGSVCRVTGRKLELAGPFVLQNDRGLVPVRALPAILGLMLATRTEYHEAGRRLFLGGVATHFTTDPRENGLSLNFTAPVNPLISTEPGMLRMTFSRDAIVTNTNVLRLENPLVSSITFSESNGQAELVVLGRVPLLAQFAADRRAIEIVPAPGAKTVPPMAVPATAPLVGAGPAPAGPVPAAVAVPAPPTLQSLAAKPPFVVMLDAGHGGDDRGALLNETLEEKAVTLALARRVRSELQSRGISAVMSRDADVNVSIEQRAAMADAAHVAIFLSLHAASQGRGVRVYTAMIDSATPAPGDFVAWDAAQSGYMLVSRALADIVKAELGKHEIPSSELPAPLKPLNNVTAVAIAVEVTPSAGDVASVNAGAYQQRIAATLAEAIVVGRSRIEAQR